MQYATETLIHYLKTVWEEAGLHWNADNESEVAGIIQSIEQAVDAKLKHETYSEEIRQKIASEQLAALVIRNDVPKCGMKDPNNWMLDESIRLTDSLLEKLAKRSKT